MSFDQRLNLIFDVIGCSNAGIARAARIDPSLISRFRTGARIPRRSPQQLARLCEGLASAALEKGAVEYLKERCGLPGRAGLAEELGAFLMPVGHGEGKDGGNLPFHEKLSLLMAMTGTASVRLAEALDIDGSLVSRYKSGKRLPPRDGGLLERLSGYLYGRVLERGCESGLAELMKVPEDRIGREGFVSRFAAWLRGGAEADIVSIIDGLLESVSELPPPDGESECAAAIVREVLSGGTAERGGAEGLRQAVLRLLCGELAAPAGDGGIRLYGNFRLRAVFGEPEYVKKAGLVVGALLSRGCRLQYVNDMDPGLEETAGDIIRTLPLYMRGAFSAYYYRTGRGGRLSNMLLLSNRSGAINADFAAGAEDEVRFRYYGSESDLAYFDARFTALLEAARPLVQAYDDRSADKYFFRLGEMADRRGETVKILPPLSLSLCTLPRRLLEKMLARSGILASKTERLLYLHDVRARQFQRELAGGGVTEYVSLPTPEEIRSGAARLNMAEIGADLPLPYSREEYSEHIRAVISLLEDNGNYNVVTLKGSPYRNAQALYKESAGLLLIRNEGPTAGFWLDNDLILGAFRTYVEAVLNGRGAEDGKSETAAGTRAALLSELGKYVV